MNTNNSIYQEIFSRTNSGGILQIFQTLFFFYFYQYDIFPNLADTFPGDAEFAVSAEDTADASGAGDDQVGDFSGFAVEFHINRAAHASAGAGIDDFFLFQFTNTHKNLLFFLTFDLQLYYDEIKVVIP